MRFSLFGYNRSRTRLTCLKVYPRRTVHEGSRRIGQPSPSISFLSTGAKAQPHPRAVRPLADYACLHCGQWDRSRRSDQAGDQASADHGPIGEIHAIVVHQTDSQTAKGTLAAYASSPRRIGAHFLIDHDGTIYQTVPINRKAQHVGLIKSRCIETHTCTPAARKALDAAGKGVKAQFGVDMKKPYPERYPMNQDAIGIEIVGMWKGDEAHPEVTDYEKPTPEEQASLRWLVQGLLDTLKITRSDVYRHPQVSQDPRGGKGCHLVNPAIQL